MRKITLLTAVCLGLGACVNLAHAGSVDPAVNFDLHVKPLLQAKCLSCHSRGKTKGGLSLETREAILQGGEDGPAAILGKGTESLLIQLVEGREEGRRMPEKGDPLTGEQIQHLRAWIDQGMTWPEGFTFGFLKAPIAPRRPELPPKPTGSPIVNPIDRFLAVGGAQGDGPSVADRVFVRRVSLDLVGMLPTPEQLKQFEGDHRADKRDRFVASLLQDRAAYAQHWLSFWNDALRNSYRGTGFIDGGRITLTRWLFQSLYDNKPYNQFVRELISPVPGSEGFTKGIVWRGVVNASQVPPVQAAQNIAQVFLGTNLKCASCHDSFVNAWKLTDSYALASVFAEKPLEINRCDKPTGKISSVGFIYPELGSIDPNASRSERMAQLAEIIIKPANGRFTRTIVNRLWAHLMGRGIVEPLDDMDQPAWNQDLLDWLADDFTTNGYDIQHTLTLIATSRAYQRASVGSPNPESKEAYIFRGPSTKRMSAEQFADAISSVTGIWPQAVADMTSVDGRGQGGQVASIRAVLAGAAKAGNQAAPLEIEARWIWSHDNAERDLGGRILLRKVLRLDKLPSRAVIVGTCDNELVLYVNGQKVASGVDWTKPVSADITSRLKMGDNVIAIEATNWPDPDHKKGTDVKGANPAALIAWVGGFEGDRLAWAVGSDATWLWAKSASRDWKNTTAITNGWHHAVELPHAARLYASVNLAKAVTQSGSLADPGPIRAALLFDDSLLVALGRTSREQVVTRRESLASTLQALELSNGLTLDAKLREGAKHRMEVDGTVADRLIESLFFDTLGRKPVPTEASAARDLLGIPVTVEGVQDLLWAVVMLPEFQLIR